MGHTVASITEALNGVGLPEGWRVVEHARQFIVTIPLGKSNPDLLMHKVEGAGFTITGSGMALGAERSDDSPRGIFLEVGIAKNG